MQFNFFKLNHGLTFLVSYSTMFIHLNDLFLFQDVISGLMTWKRFPCQSLISFNNVPNITDVWIPRW